MEVEEVEEVVEVEEADVAASASCLARKRASLGIVVAAALRRHLKLPRSAYKLAG